MNVTEAMKSSGVVAAVKDENGFRNALSSRASVVFLLKSELLTVGETVERAHAAGKKILVHVDLTEGIGKDEALYRRTRKARRRNHHSPEYRQVRQSVRIVHRVPCVPYRHARFGFRAVERGQTSP